MRGAANSYKLEVERLKDIIKNCHKEIERKCDDCQTLIKSEAYKEFADALKQELLNRSFYPALVSGAIKKVIKEKVGEE